MSSANPIREALTKGKFCYLVEIVASRRSQETRILDVASEIAQIPEVAGGSVTNNAGGIPGYDPVHIGAAVRARGLTPNIHVTCVRHDLASLRKLLEDIHSLDIEDVFAMTGDYPKSDPSSAVFDLDSVQLVHLMDELRQAGNPYWIAVAVSPFKYAEPDCSYQYLKLQKKIAAGANYAITQLGYDAGKFRELKRYLGDYIGPFPVLGNVYVLNNRAAQKMARGDIPGCWVSPELQAIVKKESEEEDKGKAPRLERAARMVAILKGLGYAGAYLGGTQDARDIRRIIHRAEILEPQWEELAEELAFAPKGGFFLYKATPPATRRRGVVPRILDTLASLFPLNREGGLRRLLGKFFGWVDSKPSLAHQLERFEATIKVPMFGCQSCGNCVLGAMQYVCPQTCPKQIRNGPCGGANIQGTCEVVDKPCIWSAVYERAVAAHEVYRLNAYIPPPDRSLQGTSSWINYFLNRDVRPNTSQSLTPLCGTMPAALVQLQYPVEIDPAPKPDLSHPKTETAPKRR